MSRILLLSLIVASLSTIVGCGARGGASKVTTSGADVTRDDSSWTPPEEVAMSFATAPAATEKEGAKTVSIRPNRGPDRPTRGAVHAATY